MTVEMPKLGKATEKAIKSLENAVVYPTDRVGEWYSNDRRYARRARDSYARLQHRLADLLIAWPGPWGGSILDNDLSPDLLRLISERDDASDSTILYAAMAIEGFLNFYGVVRLGEKNFKNLEWLPVTYKARALARVCDKVDLADDSPSIEWAKRCANSRNGLVHPKASEQTLGTKPPATLIPEAAKSSLAAMVYFFREFSAAVPDASFHVAADVIAAPQT